MPLHPTRFARVKKKKKKGSIRARFCTAVTSEIPLPPNFKQAIDLLLDEEKKADLSVYSYLLGECSRHRLISHGRRVHAHIVRSSLDRKLFLGNLLIKMYAKCGELHDSISVFERMASRNIITWTLIMDAYIQHGNDMEGINKYQEMYKVGIKPNNITMVSILSATSLHQGEAIHASVIEYSFDVNVILGTALINMYSKNGCIRSGRWVFDNMVSRDVIAWNTIIASYVHDREFHEAIQLYQQMQHSNVDPNNVSFVTLLGICCVLTSIQRGLSLHAYIVECGLDTDLSINSTLVSMYGKCQRIPDARSVFDHKNPRNVVLWNSMMTVYVESGQDIDCLYLYEQMVSMDVKPNDVTFINALGASAALASLPHGMDIHSKVICYCLESQVLLGTALFTMYGKCGSIRNARRIFDNLLFRDLVTWNAMLSVYVLNALVKDAFALYEQMSGSNVIPDKFTYNTVLSACCGESDLEQGHQIHTDIIFYGIEIQAGIGTGLIGMYNKCGRVEAARKEFERQHCKDLALWNIMLAGYVQSNMATKAIQLYLEMVDSKIHPNEFTLTAVVCACSTLANLAQGKEVHIAVVDGGYETDNGVQNALVHMYSKCGNMIDAWNLFEKHYNHRDIISWNAMITGYAQHGYGKEALEVYHKMLKQEIKANDITFASIFSACAHVGLVDDGLEYFESMNRVHGIVPCFEHYAGIIDLLGKVGRVSEAKEFVNRIPIQPDVVMWKVLLGSCKVHNDVKPGNYVADRIVELDPESTLAYVLLSNIYASYEDVERIELDCLTEPSLCLQMKL